MVNEFGLFLRKIRKNNDETLTIMASKLGISAAFLSAMEIGKKTIPNEYVDKISKVYELNQELKDELEDTINKSNDRILIGLNDLDESKQEVSLAFARKIKEADPELVKKLREVLYNDKN